MRKLLIGMTFFAFGSTACATVVQQPAPTGPESPITVEIRLSDGSPAGRVTMLHGPQGVLLRIEGENWPQGWHGAHLHAVGTCEGPGFQSAGGHVNHPQTQRPHGLLNFDGGPDHGDLQNVYAHADGVARAEVYLASPALAGDHGATNADGLALVIHASADDHVTQPIGGAGARIACAVLIPAGS
ncbi:superoxide dismutase family protein [Brevundimonas sp.]|uniref:superoxide dismutase family protein n=1 Tax=Brevundimonas sp. TaxID=1871086 RepID=UPI0025F06A0A|nr:superoxide dismutase family protein [Brevundimonas sp.]